MARFLTSSDYDAVPQHALLHGFDPYSKAGKVVMPLVHKHFMV